MKKIFGEKLVLRKIGITKNWYYENLVLRKIGITKNWYYEKLVYNVPNSTATSLEGAKKINFTHLGGAKENLHPPGLNQQAPQKAP